MCGEEKSKEKDKTASTPLVTVSDLQRLPQWSMVVLRIRMMPFKTKLTPNWKMEKENAWGKTYGKANYPIRKKEVIHLFDLKKYVDEKVSEQMNSMGGGNMFGMPNMPGGFNSGMPIPPMFGGMPNGMPNSNMNSRNEVPNLFGNNQGIPSGDFNVDDKKKKIDAKIAEIEEEEKREAANKQSNTKEIVKTQEKDNNTVLKEQPKIIEEKTIQDSKVRIDDISDDQFFNDFFSDDE